MRMIATVALCALASACLTSPQKPGFEATIKQAILPLDKDSPLMGQRRLLRDGDDVVVQDVGSLAVATLDEPIVLGNGDAVVTVPSGAVLAATKIRHYDGRKTRESGYGFCTLEKVTTRPLTPNTRSKQNVCFQDLDKDRLFEKALIVHPDTPDAFPMEPHAYKLEVMRSRGEWGQARIQYDGLNWLGKMQFWLVLDGRRFDNTDRYISTKDLPKTVGIFGSSFTIHSINDKNEIEVTLRKPLNVGETSVRRTTTTYYYSF